MKWKALGQCKHFLERYQKARTDPLYARYVAEFKTRGHRAADDQPILAALTAHEVRDRSQRGILPKGTFEIAGGALLCGLLRTARGGAWWCSAKHTGFIPEFVADVATMLTKDIEVTVVHPQAFLTVPAGEVAPPTRQRGDQDGMPPLGQTRTVVPSISPPGSRHPLSQLKDAVEVTPLIRLGTFARGSPVFRFAIC